MVTGKNIKAVTSQMRPGDPPVLVGSAQRAKDVLKWKPELDKLETIIETVWNWHKRLFK